MGVQRRVPALYARGSLWDGVRGTGRTPEEKEPKDQEGWYLAGKLHLELSQEAFEQVQTIDPAAPLAHQLAGEVMESMQNTSGAVDAYKQAIAAAPESLGALEHLANL